MGSTPVPPVKGRITACLVRGAIAASLGGLLFGFDSAVIAGTTDAVKRLFALTDLMQGFFVSSALIGTILGSFCFTGLGDRIGRRNMLKILALFFFVSAVGCGLAWDYWSLVFFRFLGGLGIGGASVFGPVYVGEISPARCRGRLVLLFQYCVTIGMLVAYLSNYLIHTYCAPESDLVAAWILHSEWRIMFAVEALPAALFGGILFCIPESPRWYVSKNRYQEAEDVLVKIGEDDVPGELAAIKNSFAEFVARPNVPLFQKKYLYPILLGFGVAALNQLSFINGFMYYLNDMFKIVGAEMGRISTDLQPVLVGIFNVLACTTSIFLIDKIGRKGLLKIGAVTTAIPLLTAAYVSIFHKHLIAFPIAMSLFVYFFCFSQGSVIWVYVSEIFPNAVRTKGQALGSFTHWGLCAVTAQIFPMIVGFSQIARDDAGAFIPGPCPRLAIPCIFGALVMLSQYYLVTKFFVETKGVPLEQIEKECDERLRKLKLSK